MLRSPVQWQGNVGLSESAALENITLGERQEFAPQRDAPRVEIGRDVHAGLVAPVRKVDIDLCGNPRADDVHRHTDVPLLVHALPVIRGAARDRYAAKAVGAAHGDVESHLHDGLVALHGDEIGIGRNLRRRTRLEAHLVGFEYELLGLDSLPGLLESEPVACVLFGLHLLAGHFPGIRVLRLGLKVGQVFEAAIPIAIIAVGVSGAAKRKNALGENVIIQSIGACSGVIVAGAIFTLPALYILQAKYPEMTVTFMQVFISSLLGGVLGILFLIPFRKYFVSDMHGKYPFPEATATTQVLISGEKGGSQAKPLLMAGMIGGLYDFIVATFGWWNENFTTRVCSAGEMLAEKAKLVFKVNTGAAVLGLGYIVGLKYASIICAGSLAVWWIIIPGMSAIWGDSVLNAWNPEITSTVGMMSPEEIFKYYAKSIGIGGIAMAGVIGIIRSWSIIKSAVGLAAKEMGGKGNVEKSIIRTQRDLSMKIIAIGSIITLILIVLFFYLDVMQGNLLHTLVAIVLVAGISFLFTTVAANAIAIVGTNPVSGMTLMTLILASVVMVAVGLKGPSGMVAALVMGGVVCTALSMAGGFITDLKIGYCFGRLFRA